ncbi:SprT family zinc-dependent metalloprotease [Cronobacter sakazakii]|nr:SprT family zinc-dependent metalloprotease [Cronobacter sakazakii]
MKNTNAVPTQETYQELQRAYDFFNEKLFENRLPSCLITLQREKHTYGYFSSKRFVGRTGGNFTDEIAMNPAYFGIRSIEDSLSTLVHEMTHLEQEHYGKPGRRRYHNKEWGAIMLRVGLHPSNTGEPGGKTTGDQMDHYIIRGGLFDKACQELITGKFTLSWIDRFPPERPTSAKIFGSDDGEETYEDGVESFGSPDHNALSLLVFPTEEGKETRTKYICPSCLTAVWGKKNIKILCGVCEDHPQFAASKKSA